MSRRKGLAWSEATRQRQASKAAARRAEEGTAIVQYIQDWIENAGVPPTVRDIAKKFGRSTSVIQQRLDYLEEAGYIERIAGVARGIRLRGFFTFEESSVQKGDRE